jgi:hypothetical protein
MLIAVFGTFLGGGAAGLASGQTQTVLHVVVEVSDGNALTYEYWLDESRQLARVRQGGWSQASGPNWLLTLHEDGSTAQRYQTQNTGAPATRAVFARVFGWRDSLKTGQVRIVARSAQESVVTDDAGATAAFDTTTGLVLWEKRGDRRLTHTYRTVERLDSRLFSAGFFSSAEGRSMSQTIETTAAEAARLAAFPVMTPRAECCWPAT